MFEIETAEAIYEIEFIHSQVNITSRCNMRCEHCRGAYTDATDMSIKTFEKLVKFSQEHLGESGGYLISGGEPLLHPQFKDFLLLLRSHIRKNEFVSITTNGYFLTETIMDFLQSLDFADLRISVSLDSPNAEEHNAFRHCSDAYEKAIKAIELITKRKGIKSIVRSTITKKQLPNVEAIVDIASSFGVDIISISSVIPVGSALKKPELYFDKESKKKLIELSHILHKKDGHITVNVNDPLAYIEESQSCQLGHYGGCIAGIGGFSVEPNGLMLPCPVLPNQVIMNINDMEPKEMLDAYCNSPYIHSLIDRELSGKCGECKLRFSCGGCRARAEGMTGNYLGEDTDC